MAKNDETTTRFKVDITELKAAMQEAKRQVDIADSSFKAVSASMDNWSKCSEGLQAKLNQLNSNLTNERKILGSLEEQYTLTVQQMGEGSAEAQRLAVRINNQQAVVNKTNKDIKKYTAALQELEQSEKEVEIQAEEASDSVQDMSKQVEEAADSTKKMEKEADDAADSVEDLGEKADDAEGGFTILKGAIAEFAGNVLTGLADALKDAVGYLLNLAEETREYRTEMAKLQTAFDSAGLSSTQANRTFKELYAVLGDEGQAVEAANFMAKLCDTQEELSEWTTIATGIYGTFGSSLPIEGLAEAANETAKVGQVTGPLADALNWAGLSAEQLGLKLKANTKENKFERKNI